MYLPFLGQMHAPGIFGYQIYQNIKSRPNVVPHKKLTYPLKIVGWKMKYPFTMVPFCGTWYVNINQTWILRAKYFIDTLRWSVEKTSSYRCGNTPKQMQTLRFGAVSLDEKQNKPPENFPKMQFLALGQV